MTRIICLANSWKHNERCIAGIDPLTGVWIRPVTELKDGKVDRRRLINGHEPSLLEVLEIPLSTTGPDYDFESENRLILSGQWRVVGQSKYQELLKYSNRNCFVLHDKEKAVEQEYLMNLPFDQRKTIELVEAEFFHAYEDNFENKRSWRASFKKKGWGEYYDLKISDPVFSNLMASGHKPSRECLLTVSLTMPFPIKTWKGEGTPCWKLVAGVIEP